MIIAVIVLSAMNIILLGIIVYMFRLSRNERETLYALIKATNLTEFKAMTDPLKDNKPKNWLHHNIDRAYREQRIDDDNEQ